MGKVLVVDDEASIRSLISDFLKLKGHTVYTASNVVEALGQARKYQPEVALLDIMLPGVHGVEILRQLKKLNPDIKAIMVTAVDDDRIAREAMAEGAVDYIRDRLSCR